MCINDNHRAAGEHLLIQRTALHRDRLLLLERGGETGDRRHRQVRALFVQQADRRRVRLQGLSGPVGQTGQDVFQFHRVLRFSPFFTLARVRQQISGQKHYVSQESLHCQGCS
jgi:hypothetical protein